MSLKVKFIGAVGTVTGSCSLLHYERSDSYYLVDCGLYQAFPGAEERNRRDFPFEPKRISAVLLTHAHIDHCGLLPRLVAEGFRGKVVCTRATRQFALNALEDAAQLTGLYESDDVAQLAEMFACPDEKEDFQFGHYYPLDTDLFFGFLRNAHIVGSVAVELRCNVSADRHITVTFSGDIGPCQDGKAYGGLQKARQYPNPQTEYLIAESTYGGRSRDPATARFKDRLRALSTVLQEAFTRGPRPVVIFPAFSLQRTQELVAELHYVLARSLAPEVADNGRGRPTVIVDSPLAKQHTEVMHEELRRVNKKGKRPFLNDKSPLFRGSRAGDIDGLLATWFDTLNCSGGSAEHWRLIYGPVDLDSLPGPVILLSSSGTCMGGPVVNHLARFVSNPQATIVITGYQSPGAPGDLLKQIAAVAPEDRGRFKLRLSESEIRGSEVQASVRDLSAYYSGHADEDGLVDFILRDDTGEATEPLTVFLNHGDGRARQRLKERLESISQSGQPGWRKLRKVFTPVSGKGWFDFSTNAWLPDASNSASSEQTEEMLLLLREILQNQQEIIALLRGR